MAVKLKQKVIYRGRMYDAGEPVPADERMVDIWRNNGLLIENVIPVPDVADGASAGEVQMENGEPTEGGNGSEGEAQVENGESTEGGNGSEGEAETKSGESTEDVMPGRDSRKKRSR